MSSLFSCFGPRKPTGAGSTTDEHGNAETSTLNEKSGTNNTPAAPAAPPRPAYESRLPKPAADATIGAAVSGVFDSIDVYVEKYYRDKTSLELDSTHEACLMLVGTPHLPSSPIDLVQSNRPNPLVCRPTSLIKHCIAFLIQQSMTMDEGGRNSLLPPWATSLPQALKGQDNADDAFDEAFAHWRVLTSYLQPTSAASISPLAKQSRTQATRAIADRIGGAFAPWESMPGAPEQRADLVAICEEAASAAALVFAQPSTFAYVWEPVNLGLDEEPRKVTVIKPGLVKVVKKGEEDPTRLLDAAGAGEDGGRATIVQPRHVSLTFPVGYVAE
ncbi:hypothetical protein BFW01_g7554 [Lasiodiplodia theobromae]|nr:hypothetical protein BFW01_g7554 [Lasiodiplodia theobromae]